MTQKIIFIGSSASQIKLLRHVESLLGDIGKYVPWTSAFTQNRSALDSLVKQTRLCDYAILIATKDDLVKTKGKRVTAPRDNVILEFGLFLGSIGLNRCYLLAEEGAKLPSDLHGITVSTFTQEHGIFNSLEIVVEGIKSQIIKTANDSELGLLPSTALAIGYYNGFIKKVCDEINKTQSISIGGKRIKVRNCKINVIIPETLDDSGVEDFVNLYNKKHGLNEATTYVDVEIPNRRGYPFHFKVDPPEQDMDHPIDIHVSDIPNTISTIAECLKLYLPTKKIGVDEDLDHLEKRELDNFARVLIRLISKNSLTKNSVSVEVGVTI